MSCGKPKKYNANGNNGTRETFGTDEFSVSYSEQAKEDFQFWLSVVTVAISIFALTRK